MFNELRVQVRSQETVFEPASRASAVLVLNAFNDGGAQIDGTAQEATAMVADDLDIAAGKHAVRTGFLVESGRYSTDVRRNATGTFTFESLDAFGNSRPTTFTWNAGNPHVSISQTQIGAYVQDDYRASKSLTVSGGIRQEYQSNIGSLHLGPRGGVVWSPFKDGKTTVRAGGGVFFDWFDATLYEQAVQLDGAHQQIRTIEQPGYPDALTGASAVVLPNGRVQLASDLTQPILTEATIGVERQLASFVRTSGMLIRRRGCRQLRGVNLNAPGLDGVRPDPTAGAVTNVESTGFVSFDAVSFNVNVTRPDKRIFIAANYMLGRARNDADSPFSVAANANDLAAERGPSLTDARHRAMGFANLPLFRAFTLGTSFRIQSALPYNITTGRDDNGDTLSNDRPAGVTRNTARGAATIDVGARLSWRIGFGGPATATTGPQVHIVRAGADSNPLDMMGGVPTGKRYSVELYAQAFNVLNRVNALNFSGVMTSPFFGRATSAAPPRRIELGARVNF